MSNENKKQTTENEIGKIERNKPSDFDYISPAILIDLRFYNGVNFVGKRIEGYEAEKPLMLGKAAEALRQANESFLKRHYCLKIFDTYRPLRAVEHFIRWGWEPSDKWSKAKYYPRIEKADLFKKYIAIRSEHTRGSAVDLTLVSVNGYKEIDMGSDYLLFDTKSHLDTTEITREQQANRSFLRKIMEDHGFEPYDYEWWHFHYKDDPYPDTYFDFPVQ